MASPITAPVNGVAVVFVNSYDGYLHAIVQSTGTSLWKKQLSSYSGNSTTISRTTIAYSNGVLVFGDNVSCKLFFVNAVDGTLRRKIEIDTHPYCRFTQSPTISNTGYIYIGTSSKEEYVASTDPTYPCCTFRGGLYKISSTGTVVWSFRTVPNNGGAIGQ
jgi:polyvinyl alcohol dehydrogenase (cytochrome)